MAKAGEGVGVSLHRNNRGKLYKRVYRRGEWRGWLEHRKVVTEALRVGWGLTRASQIPAGYTVHHIDGDSTHNCLSNLLLLDNTIHVQLSNMRAAYLRDAERRGTEAYLAEHGIIW